MARLRPAFSPAAKASPYLRTPAASSPPTARPRPNFPSPCNKAPPPVGPKPTPPISAHVTRSSLRKLPVRRQRARKIQPNSRPDKSPVTLDPAAVLDLVGFLFYDFSATAVQDQRSCFSGRLGKPLLEN